MVFHTTVARKKKLKMAEDPVFDPGLLKKKKKKKKVMVALDDDEAAPQEEVATPAPEPGRFLFSPL